MSRLPQDGAVRFFVEQPLLTVEDERQTPAMSIFLREIRAQFDRLMNEYMSLNFPPGIDPTVTASLLDKKSINADPLVSNTVLQEEMETP